MTLADTGARRRLGAYYTPAVMAEALVDAALGARIDAVMATTAGEPTAVAEALSRSMRILDPACGDGAFLVAARARILQAWRALSELPVEAPRIVEASLHGVDVDPLAAEQAQERLPGAQIRCADALLSDAAPEASLGGGGEGLQPGSGLSFDAVIGNPPHHGEKGLGTYLRRIAAAGPLAGRVVGRCDLAHLFLHLALERCASDGIVALLMPAAFVSTAAAGGINRRLVQEGTLLAVEELEEAFPGAPGQQIVRLVWRRSDPPCGHRPTVLTEGRRYLGPRVEDLLDGGGTLRLGDEEEEAYCNRLERRGTALGKLMRCAQGVVPGPARVSARGLARLLRFRRGPGPVSSDELAAVAAELGVSIGQGVFVLTLEELGDLALSATERALVRPLLRPAVLEATESGEAVDRYLLDMRSETCPKLSDLPGIARHLERFRPLLELRRETQLGRRPWYHLHWPRQAALFEGGARILSPRQAHRPGFTVVDGSCWVDLSFNVLWPRWNLPRGELERLKDELNGPDFWRWFRLRGKRKGSMLQVDSAPLLRYPVSADLSARFRRLEVGADVHQT